MGCNPQKTQFSGKESGMVPDGRQGMQRQGWCCPGTGLQGLHVGVVLNLLQPSLWVHRYKVRKPL